MIRVESLHTYPVKSCRGISLDEADVVATGLRWDRRWMVVDADGGFLSQRSHPVLASVGTRIERDRLVLGAAGQPDLEIALEEPETDDRSVTVWKDTCRATGEGPVAAAWFEELLGVPCELVRQPESAVRAVDPKHSQPGDRVAFADGYPFLLLSRASVEELNRRLEEPVPADRFRANIVVDGCAAHAEDDWRTVTIGDVVFEVAKPCSRCVVVTTDQLNGRRSPEPLRTLATYRRVGGEILFGQNLVHRSIGRIRVGDRVRPANPS